MVALALSEPFLSQHSALFLNITGDKQCLICSSHYKQGWLVLFAAQDKLIKSNVSTKFAFYLKSGTHSLKKFNSRFKF